MTARDKQRVRAEVMARLVKGLFFKHEDLSEVSSPRIQVRESWVQQHILLTSVLGCGDKVDPRGSPTSQSSLLGKPHANYRLFLKNQGG